MGRLCIILINMYAPFKKMHKICFLILVKDTKLPGNCEMNGKGIDKCKTEN